MSDEKQLTEEEEFAAFVAAQEEQGAGKPAEKDEAPAAPVADPPQEDEAEVA